MLKLRRLIFDLTVQSRKEANDGVEEEGDPA
jgi:hypothetical protein